MPVTEITAENYLVEENEKGFFHCKLEIKAFSPTTGERLSRPYIQKFDAKGFEQMLFNLKKLGYSVDILHDPTRKVEEKPAETAVETESEETAVEEKPAEDVAVDVKKAKEMAKKLKA